MGQVGAEGKGGIVRAVEKELWERLRRDRSCEVIKIKRYRF